MTLHEYSSFHVPDGSRNVQGHESLVIRGPVSIFRGPQSIPDVELQGESQAGDLQAGDRELGLPVIERQRGILPG